MLQSYVLTFGFQNFPQDNQKVRLSVNGFLCAFEVPVPGSPTSLSSPTLTGVSSYTCLRTHQRATCEFLIFSPPPSDITPIANNTAANGHVGSKLDLIPNSGPCSPETPLTNGVANGHITPVHESPFIGYIIAMHRKMVRTRRKN